MRELLEDARGLFVGELGDRRFQGRLEVGLSLVPDRA